jgi:hypothetical protein
MAMLLTLALVDGWLLPYLQDRLQDRRRRNHKDENPIHPS